MRDFKALCWLVSALLLLPVQAVVAQEKPGLSSSRVDIAGAVKTPLSLAPDDLRSIAMRNGGPVRASSLPGTIPQAYRSYSGVRLTDVLDAADIRADQRNAVRRTYVQASASDGYKAVFSWGELFNSPLGRAVLVVYERDAVPLDDSEGRIALVSLGDDRARPRHVKWLSRIDVLRVPE